MRKDAGGASAPNCHGIDPHPLSISDKARRVMQAAANAKRKQAGTLDSDWLGKLLQPLDNLVNSCLCTGFVFIPPWCSHYSNCANHLIP